MRFSVLLILILGLTFTKCKQSPTQLTLSVTEVVSDVESQPLLSQALRLSEALTFLGSSLSKADEQKLKDLEHQVPGPEVVKSIQTILDPYCLAMININPESRVKVNRGPAVAKLIQGGWVSYLVKVNNEAGVTAELQAESPNAEPPLYAPSYDPQVSEKRKLSPGQVANRFMELQIYRKAPLLPNLSGLKLEYAVVQLFSKDAGQREVGLGFNIGQGTQDIGFRNAINILFESKPSVKVRFNITDADGTPAMASFLITDGIPRIEEDGIRPVNPESFRLTAALIESRDNKEIPRLAGIYPLPSRRVAAFDEYPDFFFQPQIYRYHGEHVNLPPGKYNISYTRGPEYEVQNRELVVPEGNKEMETSFQLKRWIDLASLGWYSADHHVHAAGCSHYDSPEEGVKPLDMWRQARGEDLSVAAVLAWGPSWYHQKTFFTGKDLEFSTPNSIMHHDVEVSGFPSSHAGHIVLLGLREDDYPGTTTIEEWPSWTLPVLNWAKTQNAATGYAHSGWGLEPMTPTNALPNYIIPKMDGIGANEYIVTVTQNAVDFFSAGNTPAPWELNMWYHTLNCGFTPRLSGETDFPCIFDERVGLARSYFKPEGKLSYESYIDAIKKGRSYVSDGNSHIVDFTVNGLEPGTSDSRISLTDTPRLRINARVIANLPVTPDAKGEAIAQSKMSNQPYWHIERARIMKTQRVPVELIVNGKVVNTIEIPANKKWTEVRFNYPITKSSWLALRVYPSAHTNPVFVTVNDLPIREKSSATWCRQTVDQCWKMKKSSIHADELKAAEAAYDQARAVYDRMIKESR